MPIATLRYKLPEEETEFKTAVKSMRTSLAIEDIGNQIFRPARKHGYSDIRIQSLVMKLDELARKDAGIPEDSYEGEYQGATDLVGMLEEMFYEILREREED
jgi:hypothetical protein